MVLAPAGFVLRGADAGHHPPLRNWHSNDGRGLNDEHSRALSAALIEAIGDGAVESVIAGREAYLAELPADSFERWNVLDLATIREFAAFLADCGGFEIW